MRTSAKPSYLSTIDVLIATRKISVCNEFLVEINNVVDLKILCLNANSEETQKMALYKIKDSFVLYNICLETESIAIYELAKKKINDIKSNLELEEKSKSKLNKVLGYLKHLNMLETYEEYIEEVETIKLSQYDFALAV